MSTVPKEMSNAAAERAAAAKALQNGGFQDRENYTAKQVAMRCGSDAKTMRKFFRSSYSTVEPVGQGGRYEFDAADLPQIKQEFEQWSNRGSKRATPKPTPTPTKPTPPLKTSPFNREVIDLSYCEGCERKDLDLDVAGYCPECAALRAEQDPTAEDLAQLEGLMDLDELDAEEI